MELPLWPPLVALALGGLAYLWVRHESRRLDRLDEADRRARERHAAH